MTRRNEPDPPSLPEETAATLERLRRELLQGVQAMCDAQLQDVFGRSEDEAGATRHPPDAPLQSDPALPVAESSHALPAEGAPTDPPRVVTVLLSPEERAELEERHPELAGSEVALLFSGPRRVIAMLRSLVQRLERERRQSERVLAALTQDLPSLLGSPEALGLRRRAEARRRFLGTWPLLSSAGVAALAGKGARSGSARARSWRREGRIFALGAGRAYRYPAFEFGQDGEPLPAVREVIRLFGEEPTWTLALWFAAPCESLGGRAPAEALPEDPAAVIEAARRAAAEGGG